MVLNINRKMLIESRNNYRKSYTNDDGSAPWKNRTKIKIKGIRYRRAKIFLKCLKTGSVSTMQFLIIIDIKMQAFLLPLLQAVNTWRIRQI